MNSPTNPAACLGTLRRPRSTGVPTAWTALMDALHFTGTLQMLQHQTQDWTTRPGLALAFNLKRRRSNVLQTDDRWTASPWHFVTWPLVRLRSWGTQPSSPGCCTSCTRGTCAPARGTARSRSRCSRCTGSTPCASGRCQASAWPRPPRRASATWPTCRRRTSSTLGMRSDGVLSSRSCTPNEWYAHTAAR